MLLISRRSSEGFQIGEDIHVRVVAVRGGQVRLGISAPREIPVVRDELLAADRSKRDEPSRDDVD